MLGRVVWRLVEGIGRSDEVETQPWRPTEESILLNAQAACGEARRHIDAQAKDAEVLDTKAAALITIGAGALGLTVTHLQLLSAGHLVSIGLALAYLAIGLACCFQAIRPREGFSYGAYPSFLAGLISGYPHWSVVTRLAESLAEAREKNVRYLAVKQRWYERALMTVPFVALGVAFMAYTGALR
jgi:hypothetical protein